MHRAFAATSRIPIVATIVAILTLSLNLMPADASVGGTGSAGFGAGRSVNGPGDPGYGLRASLPGISSAAYPAFVYAETGERANSIDEFGAKPTGLTFLGNVRTGGLSTGTLGFPQNDIGIAAKNGTHGACLVHADSGGQVESFAINSSSGSLTPVSSVPEGDGVTFFPGDVKIDRSNNIAWVSVFSDINGTELVSLQIGSTCALTAGSTFVTSGRQEFYSISLAGNQLFAIDANSNTAYVYQIGADGLTLTQESVTPTQVSSPSGTAAGTSGAQAFTFNGRATNNAPQAEAHTLSSGGVLGPVAGSPSTDFKGQDGSNVYFTQSLGLLTQTEQQTVSIAAYSVTGGTLHLVNRVLLDASAIEPTSQTEIANFLLVLNYFSGTISACRLSATSGVSDCLHVATLTGVPNVKPAGIGVL
ncbi:MAG: hypothetical protein M3Z66_17450 [Chloroflexota bacterium]|nr:hypothetical protein [Chloroflexota bacterium]